MQVTIGSATSVVHAHGAHKSCLAKLSNRSMAPEPLTRARGALAG